MKTRFYHVARTRHVRSILRDGLLPKRGKRSRDMREKAPAIFLFESRGAADDAVTNWLGDEFDEDEPLTLFRVNLPKGFPVRPTFEGQSTSWEWSTPRAIPARYIKAIGSV